MKKKILIIGYEFHGYNKELAQRISTEFDVDLIEHRQIFEYLILGRLIYVIYITMLKVIRLESIRCKLYRCVVALSNSRFLDMLLSNLTSYDYDVVLIVGTREFSRRTLKELKKKIHSKRWILFKWDAESRFELKHIHDCFDKVYSFQLSDAKEGVGYLPNFHFIKPNEVVDKSIDIVAISIFDKHRYKVYMDFLKENPTEFHFSRFISSKRKNLHYPHVVTEKVVREEVVELYKKSKYVFDFSPKGQSGMSQRVLEALACGCIVITDNEDALSNFHHNGRVIKRSEFKSYDHAFNESEGEMLVFDAYYKNWINIVLEAGQDH
ncbi:glycosyltransferase family protein [Aeromonas enteropelogenes]|uniref:glycosyltransferase family protein n=1 Tax=Aeromonas enteropelogenes TaxID=29489 RepID=UPI00403DFE63